MPVKSDDPLRRVTLNLYEADCQLLQHIHGHGWTTYIRLLVNNDAQESRVFARKQDIRLPPRTLGDLSDD